MKLLDREGRRNTSTSPPPRPGQARRAFTLVEVMIAIIIGVTFLLGLWQLMTSGTRMFRKSDASLEAVQAATIITTYIVNDLKNLTVPPDLLGVPAPGSEGGGSGGTGQWYIRLEGGKPKVGEKIKKLDGTGGGSIDLHVASDELASTDAPQLDLPLLRIKKVTYTLKPAGSPGLFTVVRTEGEGSPHNIAGALVTGLELRFFAVPADKVLPAEAQTPSEDLMKPNIYLCQLIVNGASNAKLETGPHGTIKADAEYYQVPLISTVYLDQVSEMLSNRGLARYWNWNPEFMSGGAPP